MAKKPRQVASEPSSSAVTSRDTLQRLNYLYQASVLLATAIPPSSYAHASTSKSKATLDDVEHKRIPTGVGKVTEETASEDGGSAKTARRKKLKHRSHSERSALPGLSRMMVKTMREVAKKAVVRMDPTIKRTMCKSCSTSLIPGLTASIRIKPSGPHAHRISKKCTNCSTRLNLPAPPHLIPPTLSTMGPDDMELDISAKEKVGEKDKAKLTKRERKEMRQARKPVFFEREGHVTFAGETRVTF